MQKIQRQLALLASLALPVSLASAQDTPPTASATASAAAQAAAPMWVMVRVTRVNPGMAAEYEAFQKNEVVPMLRKAGNKWRDMWKTSMGEGGTYVSATPIEGLASLDNPDPSVRVLGADGARAFNAKVQRLLASAHSYVLMARPDLSYNPNPGMAPGMAVIRRVVVAPGRTAEFEAMMKNELLPVVVRAINAKSGVTGLLVAKTIFGGNSNEYTMLTLEDNFASVAKGPPTMRVLGHEASDALMLKMEPMITSSTLEIASYLPDGSFETAPPPAK